MAVCTNPDKLPDMSLETLGQLFAMATDIRGWHQPQPPALPQAGARYAGWQQRLAVLELLPVEYLLPRILVHCPEDLPPFMQRHTSADPAWAATLQALSPWDFWFQLAPGLTSNDNKVTRNRVVCRSHLISATLARLLGPRLARTRLLDLGCHSGFFSFDMAARGAAAVTGVELREENLRQAHFLRTAYELPQVHFEQADVMTWQPGRPFDVVMNLGLLYHVTDPIRLVRHTYDWCTDFAVIDTVCHKEPVSAYITGFNKDIRRSGEGSTRAELHPTYRALIDTMHDAGFVDLVELVADSGRVAGVYKECTRRCIIGFKRPLAEYLAGR